MNERKEENKEQIEGRKAEKTKGRIEGGKKGNLDRKKERRKWWRNKEKLKRRRLVIYKALWYKARYISHQVRLELSNNDLSCEPLNHVRQTARRDQQE